MGALRPIFIVGAPRSGTTLLRTMLNRHPAIWICGETNFFYKVFLRRRAFGDLRDPAARRLLVDRLLETKRIRDLKLPIDALRDALMRDGSSYKAFFTALIRLGAFHQAKDRFGEKTPGHALFTEVLFDWYPDGCVIHVVRDPRDVASSLLRVPFGSNNIVVNARTWLRHVATAERSRHRENYALVRYEDLVENPRSELCRILTSVGESFDPRLLVPSAESEDVAWWFQRAQRELDPGRVERWRRDLSAEQAALVEYVAGGQMVDLGYRPQGHAPSTLAIAQALWGERFHHMRNRATHLRSLWYYWVQPTNLAADERSWMGRTN